MFPYLFFGYRISAFSWSIRISSALYPSQKASSAKYLSRLCRVSFLISPPIFYSIFPIDHHLAAPNVFRNRKTAGTAFKQTTYVIRTTHNLFINLSFEYLDPVLASSTSSQVSRCPAKPKKKKECTMQPVSCLTLSSALLRST